MSSLNGVFTLRTPRDLREKLEADFVRLSDADPVSQAAQYAAFDFFVGAWHLADWLASATGASLSSCRSYPDAALVSHIANGAKHFSVDTRRHTAVRKTSVQSDGFQPGAFQPDAFPVHQQLVVELEGGVVEAVLTIASRVLQHWQTQLP